ncbi:MAG: hypothetical protein Athens101410_585 [Parcubacteria group bacterium Athens1014_10]|nr:MAG: hypothetical protein Athens101410_585 [Parcubacteria group bacterium Athens1014_10]TSD04646.1 MAG: hypothetical protein Athens071412_713 [Parcubacteria group bacterium Athens0714_12]
MDNSLLKLYTSPKTILTTKDIAFLWQEKDKNNLKSKISYYVKRGNLHRLRRGIFCKDKEFNPKELATSIYIPAYISYETALREEGVIFQQHNALFVASYLSRELKCGKYKLIFRKLKGEVLVNNQGIINKDGYSQASKERAFLDMIYLFKDYHFDNLRSIDWSKCGQLAKIYKNKQLEIRLKKYYKHAGYAQ